MAAAAGMDRKSTERNSFWQRQNERATERVSEWTSQGPDIIKFRGTAIRLSAGGWVWYSPKIDEVTLSLLMIFKELSGKRVGRVVSLLLNRTFPVKINEDKNVKGAFKLSFSQSA